MRLIWKGLKFLFFYSFLRSSDGAALDEVVLKELGSAIMLFPESVQEQMNKVRSMGQGLPRQQVFRKHFGDAQFLLSPNLFTLAQDFGSSYPCK